MMMIRMQNIYLVIFESAERKEKKNGERARGEVARQGRVGERVAIFCACERDAPWMETLCMENSSLSCCLLCLRLA